MKLQYDASKGSRIKVRGFYPVHCLTRGYWWIYGLNRWVFIPYNELSIRENLERMGYRSENIGEGVSLASNYFHGARNVKGFVRLLKKWRKYLPSGVEFELLSCWIGKSVVGKIK